MVGEAQEPYEDKFKGLLEAIASAKGEAETIVIGSPQTLGDDYEELVESLNRISAAGLSVTIVPPQERGKRNCTFSRN